MTTKNKLITDDYRAGYAEGQSKAEDWFLGWCHEVLSDPGQNARAAVFKLAKQLRVSKMKKEKK